MTSLHLSLWITLAIVTQLAIYLGIGFWRHWMDYQGLRHRVADLGLADFAITEDIAPRSTETVVAAWVGFRSFRVAHKVMEDDAQSVCSFYLAATDGQPLPPFLPGQFLTFRLELPTAAGGTESIIRCYSLSDAPNPDSYRVSIKRVPAGRSSNYFHDHIAIGSVLQVRAPAGHFHIDRSATPLVLIGGGIGITPMLSMLNGSLADQPGRDIWLFYGVRNRHEMVMKTTLETLAQQHSNVHLQVCFSNPLPDEVVGRDYQHPARIDVPLLRLQLPLGPYHFYICGPTPMLESLVPGLEDWGVPESHIHFEAFGPASIKRRNVPTRSTVATPEAASEIMITFAKSGKQVAWPANATNLLDVAEANGISVNSGCRAGGCGSCQTTIQAGEVAYRQLPDYDPEPGSCLLCVCTPKSNITLEA